MAVTHADLAPSHKSIELGSKIGAFSTILSILFGLLCFILCVFAEATRSEVAWSSGARKGKGERYECAYSGSGKAPLFCAVSAFAILATAVVIEHTYILVVISKSTPPDLVTRQPDSANAKRIAWLAGAFFIATWTCFAVAEVLLLVGISVESGHLSKWAIPRSGCSVIRQGLFSAAGVIGLVTVFLAAGLYLTALRAQRLSQEQDNLRRQVLDTAIFYATPPRSPPRSIRTTAAASPMVRYNHNEEPQSLFELALNKSKHRTMV